MFKHMLLLCLLVLVTISLSACQGTIHIPLLQEPTDEPIVGPCTAPPSLPGELVYLSFSESHSYRERIEGYEYRAEDDKLTAYFLLADEDEPYTVTVDEGWADKLGEIVLLNNIAAWDGFNERSDGLLDGTAFSISLTFSDDTAVKAHGYGRFPAGYSEASKALEEHFLKLLPEDMLGW